MTPKQQSEYNRLCAVMVKSISTLEMPPHLPAETVMLFKRMIGPREGSMTQRLIQHFAKAIIAEMPE
jgi:hypothetical protein